MINIQLFSIYMEIGFRKQEGNEKKVAQALRTQEVAKLIESARNRTAPFHRVV